MTYEIAEPTPGTHAEILATAIPRALEALAPESLDPWRTIDVVAACTMALPGATGSTKLQAVAKTYYDENKALNAACRAAEGASTSEERASLERTATSISYRLRDIEPKLRHALVMDMVRRVNLIVANLPGDRWDTESAAARFGSRAHDDLVAAHDALTEYEATFRAALRDGFNFAYNPEAVTREMEAQLQYMAASAVSWAAWVHSGNDGDA